jgi:hypothetical protein
LVLLRTLGSIITPKRWYQNDTITRMIHVRVETGWRNRGHRLAVQRLVSPNPKHEPKHEWKVLFQPV